MIRRLRAVDSSVLDMLTALNIVAQLHKYCFYEFLRNVYVMFTSCKQLRMTSNYQWEASVVTPDYSNDCIFKFSLLKMTEKQHHFVNRE